MPTRIRLRFIFLISITCLQANAGTTSLFLGERFCAPGNDPCIRGSIDYNYSTGEVNFHGRVGQTRKKGKLLVELNAESKTGKSHKTRLKIPVNGKSFALVKARKKTRFKERFSKWLIRKIRFEPD